MTSNNNAASGANLYEDHSGVSTAAFNNPYDALIEVSNNDTKELQARYDTHRTTRNGQQKGKLLDANFQGVNIDQILLRLHDKTVQPGFVDPRFCLVFWARPPQKVKALIGKVQQKLLTAAPNLWLMPQDNLHMTALEITHSRTEPEILSLVETIKPSIPTIMNYTHAHRARLIKPMIGFDASALALSFVPAAGESLPNGRTEADDAFTYHHLRRDLYGICENADVKVESRYVVPSSHLTIGRFISTCHFEKEGKVDAERVKKLVETIEEVNEWLKREYWPVEGAERQVKEGGEWIVGEEKGLDARWGRLWYGDGETIELGKGF
ncbi:hypothetical protein K402DRAFT_413071 [Aulographum hederae CBS 113979]|uniref:RNA ligase/cyclic nucleotide phosphodiesterase n=1 Tax=Aulographum hederae CBS 113979 TaxID=1176131 RepID=A0A6G1GXT8_9PEZI|nr:hypothetical protein K402DRAFT_413071 [Aulographum hederae CBS 113979]